MAEPITATNDATLMIARFLGVHVRDSLLATQVDRGQVDLLHAPPGVEPGIQDRVVVGRRRRRSDPLLQRDQIKSLKASDKGVMPEGFEQLPPDDIVNVLEYLSTSKVKH